MGLRLVFLSLQTYRPRKRKKGEGGKKKKGKKEGKEKEKGKEGKTGKILKEGEKNKGENEKKNKGGGRRRIKTISLSQLSSGATLPFNKRG